MLTYEYTYEFNSTIIDIATKKGKAQKSLVLGIPEYTDKNYSLVTKWKYGNGMDEHEWKLGETKYFVNPAANPTNVPNYYSNRQEFFCTKYTESTKEFIEFAKSRDWSFIETDVTCPPKNSALNTVQLEVTKSGIIMINFILFLKNKYSMVVSKDYKHEYADIYKIYFPDIEKTPKEWLKFIQSESEEFGLQKAIEKFGLKECKFDIKTSNIRKTISVENKYPQDVLKDKNGILIQAGDIIAYVCCNAIYYGVVDHNTDRCVYLENKLRIDPKNAMVIRSADVKKQSELPFNKIPCMLKNMAMEYFN